MIRGSEDLLEDLGLADVRTRPEPSELAATERRVLEALNGPTLPEAVAAKVRVALPDVLALLLELEVRGLVRSRGGRYELRSSGAAGASLERNRSP